MKILFVYWESILNLRCRLAFLGVVEAEVFEAEDEDGVVFIALFDDADGDGDTIHLGNFLGRLAESITFGFS